MFFVSSQLSDRARERKVPATRISRLVNFGGTNTLHLLLSWTHTQSSVLIKWLMQMCPIGAALPPSLTSFLTLLKDWQWDWGSAP